MRRKQTARLLAALIIGTAIAMPVFPASRSQDQALVLEALQRQVQLLEQRIRELEQHRPDPPAPVSALPSNAVHVTAGEKGFGLAARDNSSSLRLKALVQADSRWYLNETANRDTFLIRRARMIFEGKINRLISFQLVPDFGGVSGNGSLTLLDANLALEIRPDFQLKFGRFRPPLGLEQLQSDAVAFFTERSLVSQFIPNRDIGVQLAGDLPGGVSYALGVFNGLADGTSDSNNADRNQGKDLAGRVFFHPFKNDAGSPWRGLGFGLAGNVAVGSGRNGPIASGYRTDAQQRFFAYRAGTQGAGSAWRLTPQAQYYNGPLGLMAEYVISAVELENGAMRRELRHTAWQAAAGYVLTGENAGYRGVVPEQPFDPARDSWGAFELVARVSGAKLDEDAFVGGGISLSDPAANAEAIRAYGLGLNWYLSAAVRASMNLYHTDLDYRLIPPTVDPASRPEGTAVVTRMQVQF